MEQAIQDWLTDQPSFLGISMKSTDFAFVFPQLGNPHYSLNEKYYPGVVVVFEERYRAHRRQALAQEQVCWTILLIYRINRFNPKTIVVWT